MKTDPKRKWAPDINEPLLKWLDRDDDRPFFAFVNYFDVHDPYVPPQPFRSKFSELASPGGRIDSNKQDGYDPQLAPEYLSDEIDAYDGAIAYIDDQIDELYGELQKRGLHENLLLILTSDHGEAFGEHGTIQHANSLYREEIQVPFIFWQPGKIPSKVRVKQPVTNAALPTTVMNMVKGGEQSVFPLRSLKDLWEAPDAFPDWSPPLAEMEFRSWKPEKAPSRHGAMRSLVSREHHYIEHETLGIELYDWNEDPLEEYDLASNVEAQALIEKFKNSLHSVIARRK